MEGIADRLVAVGGVVAVVLGGSRARGTHRPDSDVDIGLYYRGELDVPALRELAGEVAGTPAELVPPGGWGPWVDGGGWLTIGGRHVDWIYRDLDRVHRVWNGCCEGRYEVGFQVGHPLGFYSHAYAGEVALCRVLADPTGELATLRAETAAYPDPLAEALVYGVAEADFAVRMAGGGAAGGDAAHVAGCLFRAVGVLCHALHAQAHQWLINEKGMVDSAARLPAAPADFAERAHTLLGRPGRSPDELAATVAAAATLVHDVRRRLGRSIGGDA